MMLPNFRRQRADEFIAMVMAILYRHLPSNTENNLALTETFHELSALAEVSGVEIITDAHRIAAGLPRRNAYGMTQQELHAYDLYMTKRWLEPTTVRVPVENIFGWESEPRNIKDIFGNEDGNRNSSPDRIDTPTGKSDDAPPAPTARAKPEVGD